MSPDPVLYVLAGPNGAGKTTFYERILRPATHLPFVNAADERARRLVNRESFVTETVFSHSSKIDLVREAQAEGFQINLSVILIPEALAVARVANRVEVGGHSVPEDKVRERFRRLWALVRSAIDEVDQATVYDNSRAATPFRSVARFISGVPSGEPQWPAWTPADLSVATETELS